MGREVEPAERADFAISFAGEDRPIAQRIARDLGESRFSVFFAPFFQDELLGQDGESFFEQVFSRAKEVIVLLSESYKAKPWPRYEWDVILERPNRSRLIPVRLDDAKILGLPSNIIYFAYSAERHQELVHLCIRRLLKREAEEGIRRPTEYDRLLAAIRDESKGALAKAVQLMKDERQRDPLGDCHLPEGHWSPSYRLLEEKVLPFSTSSRVSLKISLPAGLTRDEVVFNLKHCAASQFNRRKPDAISVLAYRQDRLEDGFDKLFDVGRIDFAPFGDWGAALDGVAYNIPVEEFEFSVDLNDSYFSER